MRPWKRSEITMLVANRRQGARAVAEMLGRSIGSVRMQAQRQRVSLRPADEKRGTVLGQPRGVSIARLIISHPAEGADATHEYIAQLALRAEVNALTHHELCPSCGRGRVTVQSTGLCVACHKRLLVEARNDVIRELEAERELATARQRKKRLRDEISGEQP